MNLTLNNNMVAIMSKIDLYTLPHKAQRAHLFALGIRVGRADFSDQVEKQHIENELRLIISQLRDHSYHENTFLHPLYREICEKASILDDEHDHLEESLNKLESILTNEKWEELYAELNRFISAYLAHQEEEEQSQRDLLWKHFDNERLSLVMNAFKAHTSSKTFDFLKFALPALSLPELVQIFNNVKSALPQLFEPLCGAAKAELEPPRWSDLQNNLSAI